MRMMLILLSIFIAGLFAGCNPGAEVVLVEDGRPVAVVVISDEPSPVAEYAAEELVWHVREATGAKLPVARESSVPEGYAGRIFVGVTEAAKARGMEPEDLDNDAFILKTLNGDVYVLGKESKSALPLDPNHGYSGTMFGVYEILERDLGARWLWPGKLGTYVPRAETVRIGFADEVTVPKHLIRTISYGHLRRVSEFYYGRHTSRFSYPREQSILGFSTQEQVNRYAEDVEIFQRRHRLGNSQPLDDEAEFMRENSVPRNMVYRLPKPNHAFHGWWLRYGERRPEWFAMLPEGRREPPDRNFAAMCVSNSDLRDYIVEHVVTPGRRHWVQWKTTWDGRAILDMSEADRGFNHLCHCENCLEWDRPYPGELPEFLGRRYHEAPRASNRYARFWKDIFDRASEKVPALKMPVYLYHNFMPAPTIEIEFDENVIGEFVFYGGPAYFPMAQEVDEWYREQWKGWVDTGMTVYFRPNNMLATYVMPEVTTWQVADFYRFLYRNGNVGVSAETSLFPWAAQGPMAYMYHRIYWDPELEAEDVRHEYFAAFGPAADYVEEYFDYWEEYARTRPPLENMVPDNMDIEIDDMLENLRRPVGAALAYPDYIYEPAEEILGRALEAAAGAELPEYRGRVEFLIAGLEHARLSGRLYMSLDYSGGRVSGAVPREPDRLAAARAAMGELIEFRKANLHWYVADYVNAARWDGQISNAAALYPETPEDLLAREDAFQKRWVAKDKVCPEKAGFELVKRAELPRESWRFKKDISRVGDIENWHLPETEDADWEKARIAGAWERGYVGVGWYRREFEVPDIPKNGRVYLHLHGVDEAAWVWLNGEYAGSHNIGPAGWDVPFRLEITKMVREGENFIAVRVMNTAHAGGIWRPVELEVFKPQE